jgi:hypothetical protein
LWIYLPGASGRNGHTVFIAIDMASPTSDKGRHVKNRLSLNNSSSALILMLDSEGKSQFPRVQNNPELVGMHVGLSILSSYAIPILLFNVLALHNMLRLFPSSALRSVLFSLATLASSKPLFLKPPGSRHQSASIRPNNTRTIG